MANDKSYALLAYYNAYGPKNSTIVDEILAHGDLDFQIPSSVPFMGTNRKGDTALHVALRHKDYETFRKLIESGADFTVKNHQDASVLHIAVNHCMEISEFRKCIDSVLSAHVKSRVSKNPHDRNGISHFHVACMMNRVDAVEMFLNTGAAVDAAVSSDSASYPDYTPLHFAAEYCCLQTAMVLLDRGANVDAKDARGRTPLHLLASRKMKILGLKNMGHRVEWGKFKAELETNARTIDLILKKFRVQSADDVLDETKLSYFHVACTFRDTAWVVKLLEKSVDLEHRVAANSPVWPGYTALHFAAHCNPKTVVLLLTRGADFLAKDASGVTPLDLCLQRYEAEHLHRFVSLEPTLQNNLFDDGTTRLTDAILAMKTGKTLSDFIDKIADINIALESTVWPGYTLLHLATSFPGRSQRFLVLSNNFIHADQNGKCEIQYNCSEESDALYIDRIKVCLTRGANIDVRDAHNATPLHLAFRLLRETAVVCFLGSHESLKNAVDRDNLSHLYIACTACDESAVELLLSRSGDHANRATEFRYCTTVVDREYVGRGKSTPLHAAVGSAKERTVQLLLDRGADRYARDADGLTPIHYAFASAFARSKGDNKNKCLQAFRSLASVLLFADDLRECETSFGLSHLHVACFANNVTAVEKLLINGASTEATIRTANAPTEGLKIHLKGVDGFTPLHSALTHDCKEAVVALIRCRANFLAVPSPKIDFELHQKHSDFLARTLMKDLVSRQTVRDALGLTQLHAACATLDVDRAKKLLKQGADPNVKVNGDSPLWAGDTPLHFVVIKRDEYPKDKISRLLKYLEKYGADVTLKNSTNETPLLSAFYLSRETPDAFTFTSQLLKIQSDFTANPVDNEGWSHFHLACYCNQAEAVQKYIENGVDVDQPVDYLSRVFGGCRPIHITANLKYNETLRVLLKHGADVHVRNLPGRTPFHEAVDFDHCRRYGIPFPVTLDRTPYKSLLEAGADEKCLTPRGESALEILLRTQKITSQVCPDLVEGNVNLFNSITGEGYVAMAISHEINADSISDNLIYQALARTPEKHVLDELGRSPIHNVVSMWRSKTPCDVNIKVIERLMDLGFDIDQQDLKGRTAFHLAIKFRNWKAVLALISFGSDINVTDSNHDTPLSYMFKLYGKHGFRPENMQRADRVMFGLFLEHMSKLRFAGIRISKFNEGIDAKLQKHLKFRVQLPRNGLQERLKGKCIDGTEMTLWDFLCETRAIPSYPSMRPCKRKAIDDSIKNEVAILREQDKYGVGLLLLQHRKALKRSALLHRAKYSLNLLVDYALPDVCCDLVLMYLNQEELEIFIKTDVLDENVSQLLPPIVEVEPMKFFAV